MARKLIKLVGLLFGLILLSFLFASTSFLIVQLNRCSYPVLYRLGSIDPRFHLSQEKILKVAQEAEARWEESAGQNLFQYDPKAKLVINLVYDSRQATLDAINKAVAELNQSAANLEGWQQKLKLLIDDYQRDLERYNQKVDYYNRQGGAPENVYQQLLKEKDELEKRRRTLNQNIAFFNLQINQHNNNLELLKSQIEQIKNKIVIQGFYHGNTQTIDVYTFGNEKELRLVLMHEMGHALGLPHAQNPNSIMYALLGGQNLNDPWPTSEDLFLLKSSCGFEKYKTRFLKLLHSFLASFSEN